MRLKQWLLRENDFDALCRAIESQRPSQDAASTQPDQIGLALEMLKEARRRCLRAGQLDYFSDYLSSKAEAQLNAALGGVQFNEFAQRLTPPEKVQLTTKASAPKQDILVNFVSDSDITKYVEERTRKNNERLILPVPDQGMPSVDITPGSCLTLVGHCNTGLSYIVSDKNVRISADNIASKIAESLKDKKDTPFTINLVACRAADGDPPFAKTLMQELVDRGVTNATIKASVTMLLSGADGSLTNEVTERYYHKKHILDQKKYIWSHTKEQIVETKFSHHERICESVYERLSALKEGYLKTGKTEWVARIEKMQDKIVKAETPKALFDCLREKVGTPNADVICSEYLEEVAKLLYSDSDHANFDGVRARAAKQLYELATKLTSETTTRHSLVEEVYEYWGKVLTAKNSQELSTILDEIQTNDREKHKPGFRVSGLDKILEEIRVDNNDCSKFQRKPVHTALTPQVQTAFSETIEIVLVELTKLKAQFLADSNKHWADDVDALRKEVEKENMTPQDLILELEKAKTLQDQLPYNRKRAPYFKEYCDSWLDAARAAQEAKDYKFTFEDDRAQAANELRTLANQLTGETTTRHSLVKEVYEYRDRVLNAKSSQELCEVLNEILIDDRKRHKPGFRVGGLDATVATIAKIRGIAHILADSGLKLGSDDRSHNKPSTTLFSSRGGQPVKPSDSPSVLQSDTRAPKSGKM